MPDARAVREWIEKGSAFPIGQLRSRRGELPRDKKMLAICRSSQRACYATRMLLQKGFEARTPAGRVLSRYRSHLRQ